MMEVEIDKSEPEGNGFATTGKIKFGGKEADIPYKGTTISANNDVELDILKRENMHSPKEYFVFLKDNDVISKLFGKHDKALDNRQNLANKIDKNLGKITDNKDYNFIFMYFRDYFPKISKEMAENIYDILDSQYNDLLVIPLPPSIDNIESVKNLIDVFKTRKSHFGIERPIMGMIPHSINDNMRVSLLDEYKKNDINLIGIDFNGGRPQRIITRFIKDNIIKKFGSNYFLYEFNLAKGHYIRGNIRPINDIITILCGADGFNNQRFPPRFVPNWSDLSEKKQQERIDNIRFRILDDYGEYNKHGFESEGFNLTETNETSILNKNNFDTIHDIGKTKNEYQELYENSRIHNWILTHKEINKPVRKEIEGNNLANYFKEKQCVINDVNSYLSDLTDLNDF